MQIESRKPRGVIKSGERVTVDNKGRFRAMRGRQFIMAGLNGSNGYTDKLLPVGIAIEDSRKHKRMRAVTAI